MNDIIKYKMNSYKIVYSDNPGSFDHEQILNLENKVKSLLAEGWTCIGGVVICFTDTGTIKKVYQTMIKLHI